MRKTTVTKGTFRVAPFTQNGGPLNPGVYKIEVSSPLADLQPAAVRVVIGNHGSKLDGPLAKRSQFGGGKVIEYRTTFKVGSGQSLSAQDAAERARKNRELHEWYLEQCAKNCDLVAGVAKSRGQYYDRGGYYSKCVAEEPKPNK